MADMPCVALSLLGATPTKGGGLCLRIEEGAQGVRDLVFAKGDVPSLLHAAARAMPSLEVTNAGQAVTWDAFMSEGVVVAGGDQRTVLLAIHLQHGGKLPIALTMADAHSLCEALAVVLNAHPGAPPWHPTQ